MGSSEGKCKGLKRNVPVIELQRIQLGTLVNNYTGEGGALSTMEESQSINHVGEQNPKRVVWIQLFHIEWSGQLMKNSEDFAMGSVVWFFLDDESKDAKCKVDFGSDLDN